MSSSIITMVFSDLVSSTSIKMQLPGGDISERNRVYFDTILMPHRRRVQSSLERYGGRVVKTEGDAFFIVFGDAVRAAQWSIALHLDHAEYPIDTPVGPLQARIGMHTGAPLADQDDFIGHDVDYASRVGDLANGGQVVLSEATAALARAAHISGVELHPHGERDLKGVGRTPIFELLYAGRQPQPLREPLLTPTNLPISDTRFIDREIEVSEGCDLLRDPGTRLLTLTGFAGLGKTRVAHQIAKRCVDRFADEFPEGVWWVELEDLQENSEVIPRIATDLGIDLRPQPPVADQVLAFLRERQMVLVLDNSEQIPNVAEVVKRLLTAAPSLKCVITSRRTLGLQTEHVLELQPLSSTHAVELFVSRARARSSDFGMTPDNAVDIQQLCAVLEEVPLAIELAASRIVVMEAGQMLQRMDRQVEFLKSREPDLRPRQRALRAAIDWSYELLTEDDKKLLAEVSVFAGGFTLEDAESVCDTFDVLEGVEELRLQSLLRAGTDPVTRRRRFSMLAAVRAYAEDRLRVRPEQERAVRLRHAEHYLSIAQDCLYKLRTSEEAAASEKMETELANLRAAFEWIQKPEHHRLCAELSLAVGAFLQRRGFTLEAMAYFHTGLDSARALGQEGTVLAAKIQREHAGLHHDRFEWADARRDAIEALNIFEQLRQPEGIASAYNLLGLIAKGETDFSEARRSFSAAMKQFEACDDKTGAAIVYNNLGLVEYTDTQGDKGKALRCWQESLRLSREQGNHRGVAEALINLGVLAQDQKRTDEAYHYYAEALGVERKLRHSFGVGRALNNLAEIAEARGELRKAHRLYAAAACLFDRVASPYECHARTRLVHVREALGLTEEPAGSVHQPLKDKTLDELLEWAQEESAA
ncbi:MAG: tetratricopeptide repeat protein [Armatimonadetes bacterium]|nr:tetratricopeptide repeat protein [Armatimonadota bacterium]